MFDIINATLIRLVSGSNCCLKKNHANNIIGGLTGTYVGGQYVIGKYCLKPQR